MSCCGSAGGSRANATRCCPTFGLVAPTVPPLDPNAGASYYQINGTGEIVATWAWNPTTKVWKQATPVGTLVGLSDVTVTSPAAGQVLTWNGTAWINATAPTAVVPPLASLPDVSVAAVSSGQVLSWNGTVWSPLTLGTIAAQNASNVAITGGAVTNSTKVGALIIAPTVSPPSGPITGQLWWDSTLGKLLAWDGTAWFEIAN